jgi:hypothetical protein
VSFKHVKNTFFFINIIKKACEKYRLEFHVFWRALFVLLNFVELYKFYLFIEKKKKKTYAVTAVQTGSY